MGKLDGKVAFITGAARGQGRSHAIRLAEEGADIIAIDICQQLGSVMYPMGTTEELEQTAKEVEAVGRRIVTREVDARDYPALKEALDEGVSELGGVDIVCANAGIGPGGAASAEDQWDDVIGCNLTAVWNTGRAAIPTMIEQGRGGSIILTSSTGGLQGVGLDVPGFLGYTAAKHGVIGLMRSWANFCAEHMIRVNSVAPTTVRTPMANNGDLAPIRAVSPVLARSLENAMPVDAVDPIDISNTVCFLASDESMYITGTVIPVDAGQLNKR